MKELDAFEPVPHRSALKEPATSANHDEIGEGVGETRPIERSVNLEGRSGR